MGARRKSTSITTVHIVLILAVFLGSLIIMAVILAPKKPTAPAVSTISYTEHPKDRPKGLPGSRVANEAPRINRERRTSGAVEPPKAEAQTEEARPFTLAALVIDAHTGEPIERASIRAQRQWSQEEQDSWRQRNVEIIQAKDSKGLDDLHEEEGKLRQQANESTDKGGEAALNFSLAGTYRVWIAKTGFIPVETTAQIEGEDKPRAVVEVKLSTGATVMGRVTETGSGKGIPDILIQAEPVQSPDQQQAPYFTYYSHEGPRTDDDGNYQFSGLPLGEFAISVSLRDAPYKAGAEIPYQKVKIARIDQEIRNIDFKLDPAGTVWGYVTSPDKEPVQGADVLLCTSQSVFSQALTSLVRQAPPLHDSSEKDGYYELVGVPLNKEWRLYVTSEQKSPQMADPFILTTAKRDVRIDVFMFAGTTVYGRVVDQERKPIEGASVVCIPSFKQLLSPMETPHAFRDARSDANGDFVIKDLPAGNYQVFAQKRGFKIPTAGDPIYPNGYTDLTGLELTLYRVDEGAHAIFGSIVDTAGQAVPSAKIEIEGMGLESLSSSNRDGSSDMDGRFRFDGVEAGMYRMRVTKDGYSPKSVSRVMLDRENRVVMDTAAVIRGRVVLRDTGRAPEAGYTVSAVPISETGSTVSALRMMEGPVSQSFNNADGSFELRVAAGHYRIEAQAAGYTPGRQEVTLEAGQVTDNLVIQLSQKGGTIAGRVTTSDGKSPQGARVLLFEAGSASDAMVMAAVGENASQHSTQVGQDGLFSFTDLPAGNYTALAQHQGYAAANSGQIVLQEEGNIGNIELRLGGGGVLRGYVYKNGQPVSGATVMAIGPGGTKPATSEQNGAYSIDGLSAGVYQVMMTYISSPQGVGLAGLSDVKGIEVEIQDGQVTTYNFGEGTGVTIEGRCSRPPATPVGFAVLRMPGVASAPLGSQIDPSQMTGISTGISPMGTFTMEDVPPGQWQLDVYYLDNLFGGSNALTYVGTQVVDVTGQEQVVAVDIPIQQ